jgi:predicted Zn-dependent peptidase
MRKALLALLATALSIQAQPRIQKFTFPNGLQMVLLEEHERPLVRAELFLRIEALDTPPGRQGLPLLLLRMLAHSDAADLKSEALDNRQEDSGIWVQPSPAPGGLVWRLVAQSRDQDRALGLLADRVLRSEFEPATLEVQRLACWQEVARGEASPEARLRSALGQDPGSSPTPASLGAITFQDLILFRRRVLRPDRAVLLFHGDLGMEQAKRLALLNLGSWSGPAEAPPEAPASPPTPPNLVRIPREGGPLRVQALAPKPGTLDPEAVGLLGLLIPGDGALAPVQVTCELDGLVATLEGGGGRSGAETWSLLHSRLAALRQRGFTQADLDRARAAWTARRSLDSLHPEAQMEAALAEVRGRGVSLERLRALSLDRLNECLRVWLDPARLRSGAAGDPEQLKSLPVP